MDDVIGFISRFTNKGDYKDVIASFTTGACYWFSVILKNRFGGEIVYDPVDNHFATKISEHVYDITGDVTNLYAHPWVKWNEYEIGSSKRKEIETDCINFVR